MSVKITDRDHGFSQLVVNAKKLSRQQMLRVGVSEERHAGSDSTIAQIGLIHELGLGHVPQRSFLRAWVDGQQKAWYPRMKEFVKKALMGNAEYAADFGKYAVEGIRARMRLGIMPPLLEATVKRKKNGSTPLIETEQLINGIQYDVAGKK